MKKRALCWMLVLVMVFSLLPFSAMAQVYPVTNETEAVIVRFYNGEDVRSEQRVNNAGTTDGKVPAGAIYDPGCSVGENEVFVGWAIDNPNAEPGTVDDVLDYVNEHYNELKGNDPTDGLNVYAVKSAVHYLVYYDEFNRVLKTDAVVQREHPDWEWTVNYGYVPAPATPAKDFFGWTRTPNGTTAEIDNGDTITLSATTTELYPVCKAGVWLLFDSNVPQNSETSATFTAPQLYSAGDTTVKPADPTREGYTFVNWYDNAECTGDSHDFSQPITADTTVYAKWAPAEAQYTIVFWRQDPTDSVDMNDNDKHYSFDSSVVKTATTGTTVNLAGSGVALDPGTGFSVNNSKTETGDVTVKADNSTVINVYYDRTPYTITFDVVDHYSWEQNNSGSDPDPHYYRSTSRYLYTGSYSYGYTYYYPALQEGNYYYYPVVYGASTSGNYYWWIADEDGDYTRLDNVVSNYSNSLYARRPVYKTIATVTELYEHSVKDYFPVEGNDGVTYDGYTWTDAGNPPHYEYVLETIDTMPAANVTFHGRSSGTAHTIYYYKEVVPGVEPTAQTRDFNGKTYELYKTVKHQFNFITYDEEYHDLTGFTKDRTHAEPYFGQSYYLDNGSSVHYDTGSSDIGEGNENQAPIMRNGLCNYLYYDRVEKNLKFFDGFDNTAIGGETPVVETLKYEQPLAPYENLFTVSNGGQTITYNGVSVTHKGYYFDGWYADQGCTTPFDFSKGMPNGDVNIYAKWTQMRFRIVVDPKGGDESAVVTFPETQATTFRVDYGEKVLEGGLNGAQRTGFDLIGWYYYPQNDTTKDPVPFNFDFADWVDIADMSYAESTNRSGIDPWNNNKPYDDADGENNDVVGKVTIEAKWRQHTDPSVYYKVFYDAGNGKFGDGESTYLDPLNYANGAQAVTKQASASNVDGELFSAWQVLDENGDPVKVDDGEGHLVDLTVKPGSTFNVLMDYAKPMTVADGDGGQKTVQAVTLRAIYNSDSKIHVTWVGNGGVTAKNETTVDSKDVNLNAETGIMGADTFVRDGYVFLGWARLKESDYKNPDGTWEPYSGNDIWLFWNEDDQNFHLNDINGTVPRAISANNEPDIHVLYAVWDKIDNHTYVIDFNAKMKVAEEATQLVGAIDNVVSGTNGNFVKSGTDVTYQLDSGNQAGKTAEINKAYTGVDTALVYGKLVNVENAKLGWNQITTVPASSVYYDDDLTKAETPAVTVGDGSGKIDGVDAATSKATTDADGSYYFTFYGTGIDVYCTTHANGGYVTATLFKGARADVNVNNRADKQLNNTAYAPMAVKNYSSADYYNTPSVSYTGMPADTYTLKIVTNGDAQYKLDGVRIYNPVKAGTDAATELNNTEEANANYLNLHALLLNANAGFSVTNEIEEGAIDPSAVSGVLFIDNVGAVKTMSNHDKDGNPTDEPVAIYTSQFDVYKNNGPKNEIYLDGQQAITFQVNTAKVPADTKVWIGLSAPKTGSGSVSITGKDGTVSVNSVMDMYYDFTVPEGGSITITNQAAKGSGDIIAVTNLKITGIADLIPAATQNNQDEVLRASRALFMPVTMKTVRMAANNGVDPEAIPAEPEVHDTPDVPDVPDTPDTPDEPDDPKPGWNDGQNTVQAILKQLFQMLLKGIGGLFSGLGNW